MFRSHGQTKRFAVTMELTKLIKTLIPNRARGSMGLPPRTHHQIVGAFSFRSVVWQLEAASLILDQVLQRMPLSLAFSATITPLPAVPLWRLSDRFLTLSGGYAAFSIPSGCDMPGDSTCVAYVGSRNP